MPNRRSLLTTSIHYKMQTTVLNESRKTLSNLNHPALGGRSGVLALAPAAVASSAGIV